MAVSAMKKIINSPEMMVPESLVGMELAHPDLVRYDAEARIVVRADGPAQGKVGVISGGGSGHDPLHAGFVGRGMLDAAVPGPVFTAPTPDQIVAATRAADGGAGVLHIIKNYTGDIMNFRLGREDAEDEGIAIEAVVVDDDVAVEDSTHTAGRRGVAGTVFVEKIAGAAAQRGDALAEVATIARRVNERTGSFGVGLTSCTPPSAGAPIIDLPPGEIEIGIGMHGEPGRRRGPLVPAKEIAGLLAAPVLEDLKPADGSRLLVLTNGMGSTPLSELYILHGELVALLRERGLVPHRSLVGSYVTSLEMAGASLSVLVLDDELLELWDAPVVTPGLRWGA
jgi:dihydroxyacetone kinase-like protein